MKSCLPFKLFRVRAAELARIIRLAGPKNQLPKDEMERLAHVSLARSTIVLLAGHLEGFFNAVGLECISIANGPWAALAEGHKRYISLRSFQRVSRLVERNSREKFVSAAKVDEVRSELSLISRWFDEPTKIDHINVRGFYHGAPESVDKLLSGFRSDGVTFFDWLRTRGQDVTQVRTVLDQLVGIRNDIAHGDLSAQPTISDARSYVIVGIRLARWANDFIVEQYPALVKF